MSRSRTVVSLGQERVSRDARNRREMLTDKERIQILEDQIRKLVDLLEDVREDSTQNTSLIRQILRGLSSQQTTPDLD